MDSGGDDDGDGGDDPSWFDRWDDRTEHDDAGGATDGTEARDTGDDRDGFRNEGGDAFDDDRSHTPDRAESGRDDEGSSGREGTHRRSGEREHPKENDRPRKSTGEDDQRSNTGTNAGTNTDAGADTGSKARTNTNSKAGTSASADHRTDGRDTDDRVAIGVDRSETAGDAGGDRSTITSSEWGNEAGARSDRTSASSGGTGTTSGAVGRVRWVLRTDHPTVSFVRELLSSLAIVAAVGLLLFAVSGVWPPMVAVESQSMTPNLHTGDLVFIMDEHRFAADEGYGDTGVVTYRTGQDTGYETFSLPGDVVVYRANGLSGGTPIIHRARFWVNESENWYDKANPEYLGGARACETDSDPDTDTGLSNCPAPHAGFITKGDNNAQYDQVGESPMGGPVGMEGRISSPVKPEWITGTAEFRIPNLGCVRLFFSAETPPKCTL